MTNLGNIVKRATFVPDFRIMGAVSLAVFLVAGLMVSASREDIVVATGARCSVVDVAADSRDITADLACNTANGTAKINTTNPKLVLDILRNNLRSLTCNIYADGRVRECKAVG